MKKCVAVFLIARCLAADVRLTFEADAFVEADGGLADAVAFVFGTLGYAVGSASIDSAVSFVGVVGVVGGDAVVLPGQCFLNASNDFCVAADDACECIPGYSGGNCSACVVGKFKAGYGGGECVPCDAGWSTRGAQGQARCWPCPPNTAGDGCAACGDFSEAPEEGSAVCRCVAGAAPDYSNERCVPCRAGQYQPLPGQQQCLACDGYGTSIAVGATACDGKCVAGSKPTQDGCVPCEAGTAWDGDQGCTECAVGSYSSSIGATTCLACEYQPAVGATACLQCVFPSGSVGIGGIACGCPRGTELDYSGAACAPCHPSFYQPAAGKCAECHGYSTSLTWGASACDACVDGSFKRNDECVPFPAGSPMGVPCRPGTFSATTGATACDECAAGTYAPVEGLTACYDCPDHTAAPTKGAAACGCAPGTFSDYVNRICTPCPAGTMETDGACDACPRGTYNPLLGATACMECDGIVADGIVCVDECTAGMYYRDGECVPCSTACLQESHYIRTKCTLRADIECAPCRSGCGNDEFFISAPCGIDRDATCNRCRNSCDAGFFVAGPCSPDADAPCSPCSSGCPGDAYAVNCQQRPKRHKRPNAACCRLRHAVAKATSCANNALRPRLPTMAERVAHAMRVMCLYTTEAAPDAPLGLTRTPTAHRALQDAPQVFIEKVSFFSFLILGPRLVPDHIRCMRAVSPEDF